MKYAWLNKHKDDFNISQACRVLKVCRAGYYAWCKTSVHRSLRQQKLKELNAQIKAEYQRSDNTYGIRKVSKALAKRQIKVSTNKVARLMQAQGLRSRTVRKYKVCTTDSNHKLPVYNNKLNRQFVVPSANYAWCGDITYCPTEQGWLYLATVIDLYSNKVIGYATSDKIDKWLVIQALSKALHARNYPKGIIMHSDRGSQYCSYAYRNLLEANGLIGSMSRKGNCWDNAVAENFFGMIKREFLNHYKFDTLASAKLGIFNYIDGWYNPHRSHSKLGYLSPDEFEKKNLSIEAAKQTVANDYIGRAQHGRLACLAITMS